MKGLLRRLLVSSGDTAYNLVSYYYLHLKNGVVPPALNVRDPRAFNEKIIYLKTRYRHPDAHLYADKVLVRDFVREAIGTQYLIPVLDVYDDALDIDFSSLPQRFILKANHGSTWNILCRDKGSLDIASTRKTLQNWLHTNYYSIGREYQYKYIKPRIIAEQLLEAEGGEELKDYKIFCFDGEPKFIQVDVDRFTNHKRVFFDLHWNRLPFSILYPPYQGKVDAPTSLQEMIFVAHKLSRGFPFIRVDLYESSKRVYFGEMTFHHEGGFAPIKPREYDQILGAYIRLPV